MRKKNERRAGRTIMKTMARCNHLLALPLPPAAALLADAAFCNSLTNSAFCFYRNHPQPSRNHHLRTPSLSCSALGRASHFQQKWNCATAWKVQRRQKSSIAAATGRSDGGSDGCDDIVLLVRDSLRYDLVQPHLERTSLPSYSLNSERVKNGNDHYMPTLVLVLAVSGGCDSMALFHSALTLTERDGTQTADDSGDDGTGMKKRDDNQTLWLHLGTNDADPKLNPFRVPCELHVAHFNHEQRGECSDGDEDFVRSICMQHKIPFHSFSWSEEYCLQERTSPISEVYHGGDQNYAWIEGANENASFTQDTARKWRQQKLKRLLSTLVLTPKVTGCPDSRWGAILTAHHRDDADETILLKLLRGSHLTNLWSMDARSDGFNLRLRDDEINIYDHAHPLSHPYSSIGYFAKPMLKMRKNDVLNFLLSNSLEWREDDSNNSNKYKRNKIRNELVPLLNEITGGDRALQKRLVNLEQQSRDISQFLSACAQDYLAAMPSRSPFVLQDDLQYGVVQEEALYSWIMDLSDGELQISYDKMLLIRDKIQNYPDRLQWKMDLGDSWRLERNGNTLVIFKGVRRNQLPNAGINSWIIFAGSEVIASNFDPEQMHELHFGCLPKKLESSTFTIEKVKDCDGITFVPPWRKGRSAIKLKEFLRGQKIPLHRRNEAMILCYSDDASKNALAVYIENTDKWIVNANFSPEEDFSVTKVVLLKTSLL